MKTITIKKIHCIENEDHTGRDYIHLKIKADGKHIKTIKRHFDDGDIRNFNVEFDFIDTIQLKMMEADWPDSDDHLGTHNINDNTSVTDKTISFRKDGANYRLTYDLSVPVLTDAQESYDNQNNNDSHSNNNYQNTATTLHKKITRHRDAGTGRYVTKNYADSHKKTTIKETRKV
ncbi:hypothetical protein [Olleya sp. R77988]|uniref:hypothetical protein n=1 Tax=Olleya sp. R77988 TaxID=3093875 RepID=UPI0037C6BF78